MIYFVEGAPAVGKSYYSRKLKIKLERNRSVEYFKEEYKNPIDLLRQAVLSKTEYYNMLAELKDICTIEHYHVLENDIQDLITIVDDDVFFPYMHVKTQTDKQRDFFDSLYEKELDDGKCTYEKYCDTIIRRVQFFLQKMENKKDYIFEGAILHNPLFSILGFYNVQKEEIVRFYNEIESILSSIDYEFHYIYSDNLEKTIEYAIANRKHQSDYAWESGFELWFKQSQNYRDLYGKRGISLFANIIDEYEKYIISNVQFKTIKIKREV